MQYKKFEDIPKVMGVNLLDSQLDYDYIIDICSDFYSTLIKYAIFGHSYLIETTYSFALGKNVSDILMKSNSNLLKYDTDSNVETLLGLRVDVVLDETLANAIIIW